MKKLIKEQQDKLNKEWGEEQGAARFDFSERHIILYGGGLFAIEKKKLKVHSVIGYKDIETGKTYKRFMNMMKYKAGKRKGSEVLFSKKKDHYIDEYEAVLFFEELDETIRYFQDMRRFLHKPGYNTGGKNMQKENKSLGMDKIKETNEFILYKEGDRLWQKCKVHKKCQFMARAYDESDMISRGMGIHIQRNGK